MDSHSKLDVRMASIEALRAATLVPDQSFEVVFECMSSISALEGDGKNGNGNYGQTMPAWSQISHNRKNES